LKDLGWTQGMEQVDLTEGETAEYDQFWQNPPIVGQEQSNLFGILKETILRHITISF
jgi:hypothetical protein